MGKEGLKSDLSKQWLCILVSLVQSNTLDKSEFVIKVKEVFIPLKNYEDS